ncbi:MAG: hypothetical protein M3142_16335 [Bacteroidota bacterium]|nr:hypothetical protein [Bacteroidota bacterium]
MPAAINNIMEQLPPEYADELLPTIREEFIKSGKTIVVLDDDPTGTQTSYDVTVLTQWSVALLAEELKKKPSVLFILTNTRSVPEQAAIQLTLEIGRYLKAAVKESGQEIVAISRSDSTLRGHFPAEVDAMAQALDIEKAVWVLLPAFIEGGRFTIQDVHYIQEQQELIPVADTPFAKDAVFGYAHSNLKEWVEEKTKGRVASSDVISISLEDIRMGGPQAVCQKLTACSPGKICIVNACSYKDLEVFVLGVLLAEKAGNKFICRTSATFVPIRAGIIPGKIYWPKKEEVVSSQGSLVIVGSYVPKTTSQLKFLLAQGSHEFIEVNVAKILHSADSADYVTSINQQTNLWLAARKDVVVYTSRDLEVGNNAESNLQINSLVSGFLVKIIKGLRVQPAFLIAKGGITSSDLATKGLKAVKALVLGQVIPGVPVWQMDQNSKFPGIIYVVFPGNVGDSTALAEVHKRLKM